VSPVTDSNPKAPSLLDPSELAAQSTPSAVFDLAEAIRRSMGRYDMFRQMVRFFDEESGTLLEQIRQGADAGNVEQVIYAAHRLKGTVAYLGSAATSESLERVERLGSSGDLTLLGQAIEAMEKWIAILNDALTPHRAVASVQNRP